FSSDKNGLPYQTIFYKREPLIIGRRKDQIERHNMIDQSDIVGKRIFDFGCNIGTSCILAHESGAIVEGYDLPKILNSAVRIATLMGYNIKYKKPTSSYDTLFLFS